MSESKLFLGDGGSVPQSAQDEYNAAVQRAQAAYDAIIADAPARTSLLAPVTTERQAFLDRAEAAYAAIEGPAGEKRDSQWVPGNRPADYGIGLGEFERNA